MKLKDILKAVLKITTISVVSNVGDQVIIRTGNADYFLKHNEWNEQKVVCIIPADLYKLTIYLTEVES